MFQRFGENEFPFHYLLSINYGQCRFCKFSAGTMSTNADVLRLQNHYSTHHPIIFHERFWYQKISDQEGDILIAKFGIDDCNIDDCHFSREDRRKDKLNKYTTPHMKIRLVKSHAVCFPDYLTEEDIEKNGLFSCLDHGDGVVDKMVELFKKFGLMYMWKMGQDNMKLRYKRLPPALINKIKAQKLYPQVIKTTCGQLPTQKNKKTTLHSMANTVQFLKQKIEKLKKRNAQLEAQNKNATCSVGNMAITHVQSLIAINYGEGTSAMDMSMPPPSKKQKTNPTTEQPQSDVKMTHNTKKNTRRILTADQLKYACELCDKKFGHKHTLVRHQTAKHSQ